MDHEREHQHPVRRLILPSGKTIDVVVFRDTEAEPPGPPSSTPAPDVHPDGLHRCPRCASPLVYPVDWLELPSGHWELELRCPGCWWLGNGTFAPALVEDLDLELERGTEALVRDLRQLTQANMEEELERLVVALDGDHLLPMDF